MGRRGLSLNDDEVYKIIRALLQTFPQLGVSGYHTFRCVDEDTFLDAVKKILAERKPT